MAKKNEDTEPTEKAPRKPRSEPVPTRLRELVEEYGKRNLPEAIARYVVETAEHLAGDITPPDDSRDVIVLEMRDYLRKHAAK